MLVCKSLLVPHLSRVSKASALFFALCLCYLLATSYTRTHSAHESPGYHPTDAVSIGTQQEQWKGNDPLQEPSRPSEDAHPHVSKDGTTRQDLIGNESGQSDLRPPVAVNDTEVLVDGQLVPPPRGDRRFVLIIPATSPSPDLCKTIVTALALGYPSPIIINWGVDYHAVTKWEGGQNLPKIPGLVRYLDAVMHPDANPDDKLEDDDLVVMVDAYDVWFQLPAEVLLRRFYSINQKANLRLDEAWHLNEVNPMRQTVIAASGKNCHPQPDSGSNTHCNRLPQSPLRADLYGPDTEKNATKHRDHRPRYINGGLYMGPARDMRRLFRRAMQKLEAGVGQGVHLFSEQGIPGEVLGEQEVWRQWRRAGPEPLGNDDAESIMDRDFEYHFGLDYQQELSVQTFWTDVSDGLFDGAFITLNDQTDINQHSDALNIRPVRLTGVPEDVRKARNPMNGLVEAPDWGDMPLYADFFTECVPAIVHHNGFKERRTLWWDKPWFHGHLRQLLLRRLAAVEEPSTPLAVVAPEEGSEIRYWGLPTAHQRPRLMSDSAPVQFTGTTFQDVCRQLDEVEEGKGNNHWWDEVFRDTEGPIETREDASHGVEPLDNEGPRLQKMS